MQETKIENNKLDNNSSSIYTPKEQNNDLTDSNHDITTHQLMNTIIIKKKSELKNTTQKHCNHCLFNKKNCLIFALITLMILTIVILTIVTIKIINHSSNKENLHLNKSNIAEFEENIEAYIKDNEVIVFEEDIELLTISNELTIDKNTEMISKSESKLKISCPQSGKRLFNIKQHAMIKLIGFKITDCHYIDKSLFKIANYSSLILENVTFSYLEIANVNGVNLIQSECSEIYMNNVYFSGNVLNGGYNHGFYFEETIANIKNSEFSNNSIYGFVGTIFNIMINSDINMENIAFIDNASHDYSSSIDAYHSNIKFKNITALGNKSIGYGGFADFNGCKVSINDFLCHKNEVSVEGGCIYLSYSDIKLQNVIISENESLYGGAIFMWNGTLEINDSVFYSNSAKKGGSFYLTDVSCSLKNSILKLNTATYGSCFLLQYDSILYAENTRFIDNESDYGSFGYNIGDSDPEVKLVNCTISDTLGINENKIYENYSNIFV